MKTVEVLLLRDVDYCGKAGDVVKVKGGYARNYLIPKGLAIPPSREAKLRLEATKRKLVEIEKKLVEDAKLVVAKLKELKEITICVRTNEQGVLYGSITPTMVAEVLADKGIKVAAKSIEVPSHIKRIGKYSVKVKPFPSASAVAAGVEEVELSVNVLSLEGVRLELLKESTPEAPKKVERREPESEEKTEEAPAKRAESTDEKTETTEKPAKAKKEKITRRTAARKSGKPGPKTTSREQRTE